MDIEFKTDELPVISELLASQKSQRMNYIVAPLLDGPVYKDNLDFFSDEFDAMEHAHDLSTDIDKYIHRSITGL